MDSSDALISYLQMMVEKLSAQVVDHEARLAILEADSHGTTDRPNWDGMYKAMEQG